jgi:uncharacterized membrane protein/methylglyoxal synthase
MMNTFLARVAGIEANDFTALRFDFNAPVSVSLGFLLLLIAAGLTVVLYNRALKDLPQKVKTVLLILRTITVVLALFLLLDPCIVGEKISPGENIVALLFDDSRSMKISGADGVSRAQRLKDVYAEAAADFEDALQEKFQVIRYRLGTDAERISEINDLDFEQPESNIMGGIKEVVADLEGTNVAAVILFSDGIQQSTDDTVTRETLSEMEVPVFTVGADLNSAWRDLSFEDMSVRRSNFDKSPVTVAGTLRSEGLARKISIFEIIEGSRVVKSTNLTLDDAPNGQRIRIEFVPQKKGWVSYRARVRLAETGSMAALTALQDIAVPEFDRLDQNNESPFIIDNRQKEYRILYFAGRPTWENKFFTRAMAEDDELRHTNLIRVSRPEKEFKFRGKDKAGMTNPLFEGFDESAKQGQPRYDEAVFLRQGVEKSELVTGYPIAPEGLFPYDLVIWADIEHDFFSLGQLETTRDFVQKRGGAFLLLGGLSSFAEGGYAGTIVDGMLPVVLRAVDAETYGGNGQQVFVVQPTADGLFTGTWSLDSDPERNAQLWSSLAPLYGLNAMPLTRPGASVMSRVKAENHNYQDQTFYAVQRYGLGECAVLATGDTWPWKMRAEEADQRHERLWRQVVRSLVQTVPDQITLRDKQDHYTLGNLAELQLKVKDKGYEERDGLRTSLTIARESQEPSALAVEESIQETGLYTASFKADEPGMYHLQFDALNDKDEVVGTLNESLLVVEDKREFENPKYNPGFLAAIAQDTGGAAMALGDLAQIPKEIPWKSTGNADEHRFHFWYYPPIFYFLIALMALEWYLRRRKGHA